MLTVPMRMLLLAIAGWLNEEQRAKIEFLEVLEAIPPLFKKLASSQLLEEVIFFNNAGTNHPTGMISHKDTQEIIANIHVNFTSPILLIGEFVRRHHGRLAHEIALFGFPGLSSDEFPVLAKSISPLANLSGLEPE